MILFVSGTFAILAAALVVLLINYFQRKNDMNIFRRMRRHQVSEQKTSAKSKETFKQTFHRLIQKFSKPLENKAPSSKLDLKLNQAGIPFNGAEFIVANLFFALVGGILIYMLTINFGFAVSIALLIPFGSFFAVLILIRRRKNSFTEQLGDCLITVANALRAGYSFQQAMEVIANEMEPPISEEFARMTADVKMGVPLELALDDMGKRVDNADFTLVITAVLIQREVGGNLAQILDTISDTIMERIRMKREIHALTSQGRFSALILLILPFALGFFMFLTSPGQVELLFEEPMGQMAIVAALLMDLVGFWIIQRIVNIDV